MLILCPSKSGHFTSNPQIFKRSHIVNELLKYVGIQGRGINPCGLSCGLQCVCAYVCVCVITENCEQKLPV